MLTELLMARVIEGQSAKMPATRRRTRGGGDARTWRLAQLGMRRRRNSRCEPFPTWIASTSVPMSSTACAPSGSSACGRQSPFKGMVERIHCEVPELLYTGIVADAQPTQLQVGAIASMICVNKCPYVQQCLCAVRLICTCMRKSSMQASLPSLHCLRQSASSAPLSYSACGP